MSLITALLLAALTLTAGVAYRRRGDRWYAGLAMVAGLGLLIFTARARVTGIHPTVSVGLLDIAALVVLVVVAAEAFGLPMVLAKRLGFGLRSRDWEFDRQLRSLLRPLNEVLQSHPSPENRVAYDTWRRDFIRQARRRTARLRRLHPPSEQWASVAAAYADIYDAIADLYRTGDSPEKRAIIKTRTTAVDRERELLRTAYRAKAATILGQSSMARLLRTPPRASGDGTGRPDDAPTLR